IRRRSPPRMGSPSPATSTPTGHGSTAPPSATSRRP
ncbi:MAG: ABC transporter ATP-binding protein, partial [Acidimicrobiia bacterium]